MTESLFRLDGKTALVTGASSGLGRRFAMTLAAAGANVAIAARRQDKLEQTAELVRQHCGTEACCIDLDVVDSNSISAAYDAIEGRFGVVDVIVNNAGISRVGTMLQGSEKDWDAVIDTNLKAVWTVAREGVRRLKAVGAPGSVINISSILAFAPAKGLGAYMASKSGVVQLTRAMALEWAPLNIRVNAIAPGYFPTEMNEGYFESPNGQEALTRIPLGRIGKHEELDGPLLLLASDASSYMNGSVITVDGGHLCRTL